MRRQKSSKRAGTTAVQRREERPPAAPGAASSPAAAPVSLARAERLGHRPGVVRADLVRADLVQTKALVNAPHMASGGSWTPSLDGQGRVTRVVARNLKLRSGYSLPGSGHNSPSAAPPGWTWLSNNNLTHPGNPPNYVRLHMLNGQLGGPGNDAENLAPGTASLNTHHEKHFESEAKHWLNQGGEIDKYVVDVTYQGASGSLASVQGKANWKHTLDDLDGEFDFVHYKGKKRRIGNAPFSAEEDTGLDSKPNWTGH